MPAAGCVGAAAHHCRLLAATASMSPLSHWPFWRQGAPSQPSVVLRACEAGSAHHALQHPTPQHTLHNTTRMAGVQRMAGAHVQSGIALHCFLLGSLQQSITPLPCSRTQSDTPTVQCLDNARAAMLDTRAPRHATQACLPVRSGHHAHATCCKRGQSRYCACAMVSPGEVDDYHSPWYHRSG
jgi:hypothetical protein